MPRETNDGFKCLFPPPALCTVLLGLWLVFSITASRAVEHGAAATVRGEATDAAITTMQNGGNAIDGAVAAALTLGIVDGANSGIGGGCFMLIRTRTGEVIALDGREMAPAAATRDMFVRNGKVQTDLSLTGPLAVGIPGSLAVYDYALKKFGHKKLREHLSAAANLAEHGFIIDHAYFSRLSQTASEMKRFDATRRIYLHQDGTAKSEGERLIQPDLAKSYRSIASEGIRWFYNGAFARNTQKWMKGNGGIVTAADFSNYRLHRRPPLHTTYRGYEIYGFPPPSSGGVHVAEILNILENFEVSTMQPHSPELIHLVSESMRLAFADRAFWLGDPDFTPVPRGLISKTYAAALAREIDPKKALTAPDHHTPPNAANDLFGKHTTHFSVADSDGNWVACTTTINTTFGSKVVIPGTGIVLNNQMDDFAAQPGIPNFFGLVGAEANAVGPKKRPLSSMSPTIVLKDGKAVLSVGAAGGPTIISQTLLALIDTIDFKMPLRQALAEPRWHEQWRPDQIAIEKSISKETLDILKKQGHSIAPVDSIGAAQGVAVDESGFVAEHDPRVKTGTGRTF
jgi:gamma-glutamyltranspeptidase/glutathione hydrolase